MRSYKWSRFMAYLGFRRIGRATSQARIREGSLSVCLSVCLSDTSARAPRFNESAWLPTPMQRATPMLRGVASPAAAFADAGL